MLPANQEEYKKEFLEMTVAQIPLKRPGKPSDIANAVHYFVSDESAFVTGQTLIVYGGQTLQ